MQDEFIHSTLSRKSSNSLVEIFEFSVRNKKILRNFEIFLPKFHFILPNFYLPVPWGIFDCSVELSDFLGRDCNQQRCRSSYKVSL